MFKCSVCGTELPDEARECTNCKVYQEPPAKFKEGDLVKFVYTGDKDNEGYIVYNYVVGSYFNRTINMRMYRLHEAMSMPVWREDWLEAVSEEEISRVNASGLLRIRDMGGWHYPLNKEDQ